MCRHRQVAAQLAQLRLLIGLRIGITVETDIGQQFTAADLLASDRQALRSGLDTPALDCLNAAAGIGVDDHTARQFQRRRRISQWHERCQQPHAALRCNRHLHTAVGQSRQPAASNAGRRLIEVFAIRTMGPWGRVNQQRRQP